MIGRVAQHLAMRQRTRSVLTLLVAACGATLLVGLGWFQRDRARILGALCEAGLPNLSRPSVVQASDLGCSIVGHRRRVTGVLLTGFEASSLIESDLPPSPKGGGFSGSTWFTCNQLKGCDKRLDNQLNQKIAGLCDTGLATVVAYGWATETSGHYGHLGVYAREFFVDEVVAVGPPPPDTVDRMRRRYAEAGAGQCL